MFYSDAEFSVKVNDKPGNIRLFRNKLRVISQLEDRQKLDDVHAGLFKKIKEHRETYGCSWKKAMDHILKAAFPETTQQESNILLENNRILKQLLQDVATIKKHFHID